MFNVGRFDPTAETKNLSRKDNNKSRSINKKGHHQTKQNKRKRSTSAESGVVPEIKSYDKDGTEEFKDTMCTLRVIAPEAKPALSASSKLIRGTTDEGFDDFDFEAELLEGEVPTVPADEGVVEQSVEGLSEEIKSALHMSTLPIKEAAKTWDLAPFLVANLERDSYLHFFPIQSLVIPDVIATERHSHIRARDVCVAAPTGSGKTLAFVIPVLNALATRRVRRLRALIILPSRDLATQVFEVFDKFTEGSDLKIGLAIGQSNFIDEQRALTVGEVDDATFFEPIAMTRHRHIFDQSNLKLAMKAFPNGLDSNNLDIPRGGRSAVDVLVCTPGRLIDHLEKTPGFTLQHLRFLVIDEADRLVSQSYHSFIGRIVTAANSASDLAWRDIKDASEPKSGNINTDYLVMDPITWRRGEATVHNPINSFGSIVSDICQPVQLRKMLFSATLTKDPQKLASLGLVNPKYYDAHHLKGGTRTATQRYSMPHGLAEFTAECTAEQKPLVLVALILEQFQLAKEEANLVVVFTSSLDSTHRLVRLLQLIWAAAKIGEQTAIGEFSSALSQKQRSALMQRCNSKDGGVSVVVCSDSMSRGMDISAVCAVINYDLPSFAKTYVHRCGRTARAGREGTAISVLKGGQVQYFKRMRELIDRPDLVHNMPVKKELAKEIFPHFKKCVQLLRDVIEDEARGNLNSFDLIPGSFLKV